jgi:hypothetical protein
MNKTTINKGEHDDYLCVQWNQRREHFHSDQKWLRRLQNVFKEALPYFALQDVL